MSAETPGRRVGPYEIVHELGRGGMGVVYLARDVRLGRSVALKTIPPEMTGVPQRLARLEREARLLATLAHPGIAAIHGLEEAPGGCHLVLEFVDGETLESRLSRGALDVAETIRVGAAIADAVEHAHERGVVHRDLKPGNVMLTAEGAVKVLDFGLARVLADDDAGSAVADAPTVSNLRTQAGVVLGTGAYMSPEQARGRPVDRRTDIWAFGCILYECLVGAPSFGGETISDVLAAVLTREIDWSRLPPETPPVLRTLLTRCLDRDPRTRLRDIGEARIALTQPEASTLAGIVGPAPPAPRRGRTVAALALVVAATATVAALVARRWPAPSPGEGPLAGPPMLQQLTWRNGNVLAARFAGDGGTIVYGAAWDGGPREIQLATPGSPESRPLGIRDAEILAVSSRGELALLMSPTYGPRLELDAGTLARADLGGGAPRLWMEGVRGADWSPDGESLAVVRVEDRRERLEYPIGRTLVERSGMLGYPRVAPDGVRVACIEYDHLGLAGRVLLVEADGTVRTLAENLFSPRGLAWSPDGGALLMALPESRHGATAIVAIAPDGTRRTIMRLREWGVLQDVAPDGRMLVTRERIRVEARIALPGQDGERDIGWLDGTNLMDISADGRWCLLAECAGAGGPECTTYLRATDGAPAIRLADGYGRCISPDGRWVLCTGGAGARLVPTGVGEPRTLSTDGLARADEWRFAPDGASLICSAETPDGLRRLHAVPLDGGAPRVLSERDLGDAWLLDPSATRLLRRGADGAFVVAPLGPGDETPAPGFAAADRPLAWTPDGIFVRASVDGPRWTIDLVDPATGAREPWRTLGPESLRAVANPDLYPVIRGRELYGFVYVAVLSDLDLIDPRAPTP